MYVDFTIRVCHVNNFRPDGYVKQVPKKARAVIIGGGVIGCSVAYHLAHLGWKDSVLLV